MSDGMNNGSMPPLIIRGPEDQSYYKNGDSEYIAPNDETTVRGSLIKKLPKNYQGSRAGVIVYTMIDGVIKYFLGVDSQSGDLTDMGGGVKRRDKNAVCGGLREFTEESLGAFGVIDEQSVQDCFAIYSSKMMIMFLHLKFDVKHVIETFDMVRVKAKQPEIVRLQILSHQELMQKINTDSNLFSRVRNLLLAYNQSHGDFLENL